MALFSGHISLYFPMNTLTLVVNEVNERTQPQISPRKNSAGVPSISHFWINSSVSRTRNPGRRDVSQVDCDCLATAKDQTRLASANRPRLSAAYTTRTQRAGAWNVRPNRWSFRRPGRCVSLNQFWHQKPAFLADRGWCPKYPCLPPPTPWRRENKQRDRQQSERHGGSVCYESKNRVTRRG
jgi:hypothetical protein